MSGSRLPALLVLLVLGTGCTWNPPAVSTEGRADISAAPPKPPAVPFSSWPELRDHTTGIRFRLPQLVQPVATKSVAGEVRQYDAATGKVQVRVGIVPVHGHAKLRAVLQDVADGLHRDGATAKVVGLHRVAGRQGMAGGIVLTKSKERTVSRWQVQVQVVGKSLVTIQTMALAGPGDAALKRRVLRVQQHLVDSVH
ncbi:MAG: hypothetical protein JWO46_1661 [Nocardioidaceae bacterium]|nr:hypothetical protein [Nocardioidaceae bacterium]